MLPSEFSKKILIITGDQSLINRLIEQFALAGYESSTAANEHAAIDAITKQHPDLIILDLSIDRVDSFQIFEMLRGYANRVIAETPVIIAIQGDNFLEISKAIKLGAKDYFVKETFDAVQVMEKIQKYVGRTSGGHDVPIARMGGVAPAPSSEALPKAPIKILIVEDDKFLRDLASQKISKEGMTVIVGMDGEQGLKLAEKELPDVILLDILLPGIDGFEVLRRIRLSPALTHTSVIMLSNFGQREDIEKALKAGADQFIVKANETLDEIVDEVKKIIAHPHKA